MVPKETSFIKWLAIDLFLVITRLPPHDVQRIPTIVRLMMILSRSKSAIFVSKNENVANAFKKNVMNMAG